MLTETEEKFFTDRLEKMSLARIGNDPKEEIIEPEIVDAVPIPSASSSEQKNDSLILSFQQRFHVSPFPLTAEKLEIIVRAIDWEGPQYLGFFYPVELRKECGILIPYPILYFADVGFQRMLATWNCNSCFFKCQAIGTVLNFYYSLQSNGRK